MTDVIEAVEAAVENVVEKVEVEISDAEKVVVTKMENEYLKLQMQMQQLGTQIKGIQDSYKSKMEELAKKYVIDTEKYFFDSVETKFKLKSAVQTGAQIQR